MENIFIEIDDILTKLISNIQILHTVGFDEEFADEAQILHKAQESLLQHLIYLHDAVDGHPLPAHLEEKLSAFDLLNQSLLHKAYTHFKS